MTKTNERLFSEFPEVTTPQWEEKIQADLKGKDYEKALVILAGNPDYKDSELLIYSFTIMTMTLFL